MTKVDPIRVTFVLPGASPVPAGGPRMVLRYANALARHGCRVTVVMPAALRPVSFLRGIARGARYYWWMLSGGWSPRGWMRVDSRVKLSWVPNLNMGMAPDSDAVVATAVQTAEAVSTWPAKAGRKFYFVQGYETWDFPAERVEASWRLPMRKIAVSRWLVDLIEAAGERAEHVPNGVDRELFGLDRPIETRTEPVLLWPWHPSPLKGALDALAVLPDVAKNVPGLRIVAFGTAKGPRCLLPVEYHRNPSQAALRGLYNGASVMMAPSHAEGWGLPACEALQCGCAVAASDVGGHREFLRDGANALFHRPGDRIALARNVVRLLTDNDFRQRLAIQGERDMAALDFEVSVRRLLSLLGEGVSA